jgi:hypothetical protein
MRRNNLAVICPSSTDATSFYRGYGVMGHLRRICPQLNIVQLSEINWATLTMVDAMFMQRPFTDGHLLMAKLTKRQGIPLWVDFDDALLFVPEANPTAKMYGDPRIRKNVAEIAAMADVMTVTTEHLAELMRPLCKDVRVIPNAFPDHLIAEFPPVAEPPLNRLVMWRGSNTHRADLNLVAKQIVDASHKHRDWTWLFCGEAPWFTDFMPRDAVTIAPPVDILEYFDLIAKCRPSLMLVPLVDDDFNRAKSNIAWLEGTYAGAAVLASHLPEFQRDGATTFRDATEFADNLSALLTSPSLPALRQRSLNEMRDRWVLTKVNKQRADVVAEIMG